MNSCPIFTVSSLYSFTHSKPPDRNEVMSRSGAYISLNKCLKKCFLPKYYALHIRSGGGGGSWPVCIFKNRDLGKHLSRSLENNYYDIHKKIIGLIIM